MSLDSQLLSGIPDFSAKKEYLKRKLSLINIEPTDLQSDRLLAYYYLLTEKNKVMNLTAITEFEEVVVKHFMDSLALLSYSGRMISSNELPLKVLDLGTGAGLPGIPLKIMLGDNVNFVLADSLNKRIRFLEEVIEALGLVNITAIHGRAEDLAHDKKYREQFDYCVSRAVANLTTLSEYTLPFVKPGGEFIAYKSVGASDEEEQATRAIGILSGKVTHRENFVLPETDFDRSLIIIKKIKPCPGKYPRKAGLPSKEPLK